MLQVKTFDDVDEFNNFLKTISDDKIKKIDWKVISEDNEEYSEYFIVIYRV